MSQSHIIEWAANITMTYKLLTQLYVIVTFVAHSVICDCDICCSLSYMWLWHLLLTQLYVMVTFVAHSVICDCDITNVTITYNWVSNKCHHDIQLSEQQMSPWHITEWATNVLLFTQCICDGDICCSLSYMSWWHLLLTQLYVMVTFVAHSVICNKYHHRIYTEWTTNVTRHITEWATDVTRT
jgi:hypothetical protein